MILEEFLGIFISLLSICTCATAQNDDRPPQREIHDEEASTSSQQQLVGTHGEDDRSAMEGTQQWDGIHREYESEDENHSAQVDVNNSSLESYASLGDELTVNVSLRQSLQRSLLANLQITFAAFLIGVFSMGLVYFELTRPFLCGSKGTFFGTPQWGLISDQIEDVCLNMWIPATLVLLFGWIEFKKHYLSTFYISCAVGATVIIYKSYLFIFHIYTTKPQLVLIGDVMLTVATICNSFVVARNFCRCHPRPIHRQIHIFAVIIVQFILGIALAWTLRFPYISIFNGLEKDTNRALFATTVAILGLIFSAICNYFAVEQSPGIINPERRFLLVYMVRGVPVAIYRMMQADFKMIWLYIAFSILHGVISNLSIATQHLREKMWKRLGMILKRTCCCKRLRLLPYNTPQKRRLDVDLEIQDMLFQYIVITMSQGYLALYQLTSSQVSLGTVLKDTFVRIAIGLGIEFIFNCVSIFIQIHFYNLPIRRIWFEHWKRHVIANVIVTMAMMLYFCPVLFTIYETRQNGPSADYIITNCTLSFL